MEKLPENLPEKTTSLEAAPPSDQPRLVRPATGMIWFYAIMFFLPLLMMIIFAIFLIASGVLKP